ncbi:hypothetical protein HUG10_05435 [Halorarum halophilum]|uniref:CHAT domain-containing protein n=1 Tax=Halorarum halophilum TaxID=2743090 RepID=A0A7D5KCY6_9EURY|nr:hypothetical protein [Halobaculum halophilum]QLG27017.1 hypothetical protein HUG10_05435 [Halobaculum halophilum]
MDPIIEGGDGGLEIRDPIERRRVVLETDRAVSPTEVDPSALRVPVGSAVRVAAREIVLPRFVDLFVRDASGDAIADANSLQYRALPAEEYVVEVNAPVKVYLTVDSALELVVGPGGIRLAFPESTPVTVGARSYHHRPSATITTTTDPADLRTAISSLSSALKTTGPERSYPTLRGHPPLVELGERLSVPDEIARPETGVRMAVPSTVEALFAAAPLAYYLGAELVAGEEPRLLTDAGLDYDLTSAGSLESTVRRVLERVFFLDCLLRTEGYAGVDLSERAAVADAVDLEFDRLYDEPLAEQLAAYLSVPYDEIAEQIPTWSLVACFSPDPEGIEALPFVVDELATVRVVEPDPIPPSDLRERMVADYLDAENGIHFTRGRGTENPPFESVVALPESNAVEQVWFGPGLPWNASKGVPDAYRNGLGREPNAGPIDITVVRNDSAMDEESTAAADAYRSGIDLPFDVHVETDLSTSELRRALAADADFLHYVGHIDPGGFRCRDGLLDAESLDAVGVDAFLLNGCRSYEQGVALVERGAIGGVVTLSEVINSGAVDVGRTIARLLNRGFPLRAALALARSGHALGGHYLVVGDGTIDVAQNSNGAPIACELERTTDGAIELIAHTFLPSEGGMGTVTYPFLPSNDRHHLAPGASGSFQLRETETRQFFDRFAPPAIVDGNLLFKNVVDQLNDQGP